MIPHTDAQWQTLPWQVEMRNAIRSSAELREFLALEHDDAFEDSCAAKDFPVLVPKPYARRMKPGDPHDPLLLQVLGSGAELSSPSDYALDPLQEGDKNPLPGLIHKYHGRVLLIAASGCAVNCRYCFRRHFDYSANSPSRAHWPDTLSYIEKDSSISEVILSGGDPLLLPDNIIAELIGQIASIGHIKRLRIHTRLPVVLPARITPELCEILSESRFRPVMVIHCNHPNEVDDALRDAIDHLSSAGVTVLNQSVLLAGVNDDPQCLAELSEALFETGVMPYYLHMLDKVRGAAHFAVPEARALDIYRQLISLSSGYLVPRLVRECPNQPSKVPLSPY
ncbi:MAG: EF-P beta-lysylation protein EpmB [Halioglobus sp.]|jgi:EF-P beta-lysylation protein EpmB